jgi:hypothetical protein
VAEDVSDGSSPVAMPNVRAVASSLRRSLVVYAGAPNLAYLDDYLTEFMFRFNGARRVGPRFYWLTWALLQGSERDEAERAKAFAILPRHPLAALVRGAEARRVRRGRGGSAGTSRDEALDILLARFTRGEISLAEFEERRRLLGR